ncbi:flavin-containing monooxygenase [Mycolicibacterium pulveris]|uniref:flavin-containing monooxygenase n=1 Tax=Mycolicibacterium pulveris TaxID=36813 RepID=UPI003CF78D6A
MEDALVIGSGPAGLACAAELRRRGVPATILERGTRTGAAWAGRYNALRFNTCRWHSALPGAPFPRSYGWFPTRDQYVAYLQQYADSRNVPVRHGTAVLRLDPVPSGGWALTTNRGLLAARHVVVATGVFHTPAVPPWQGRNEFHGNLIHAAQYRNPDPFAGQRVLVVGAGSTGLEIAHQLVRGGASSVMLAVRTPPNILPRVLGGLPGDLPLPLFLHLPSRFVDRMLMTLQGWVVGDLSDYGLDKPVEGPLAGIQRRGAGTAVVDREVVDAIRGGSIRVVASVDRLIGDGAVLADGLEVAVDAVIAATGYRTGLPDLVGHLGVLDDRGMPRDGRGAEVLPGLRFVGFVFRPGLTRFVGLCARRLAKEVAAQRLTAGAPAAPWTAAPPVPGDCSPPAWRRST